MSRTIPDFASIIKSISKIRLILYRNICKIFVYDFYQKNYTGKRD